MILGPKDFHDHCWGHLPEGGIGMLRVRRSGRVELQLGGATLLVRPGIDTSFVQDVVSLGECARSFDHLGHVQRRVVCTPDFVTMLRERELPLQSGGPSA